MHSTIVTTTRTVNLIPAPDATAWYMNPTNHADRILGVNGISRRGAWICRARMKLKWRNSQRTRCCCTRSIRGKKKRMTSDERRLRMKKCPKREIFKIKIKNCKMYIREKYKRNEWMNEFLRKNVEITNYRMTKRETKITQDTFE